MRGGTTDDLGKRLRLIEEGMGRVRSLAEAERWEEAQEMLRLQEQACRQFARLLAEELKGPVEPHDLPHQLDGLKGLVAELQEGFGGRRDEILRSLRQLNHQEQVTREYGGSAGGQTARISPEGRADGARAHGGGRPRGPSGRWTPARMALYR